MENNTVRQRIDKPKVQFRVAQSDVTDYFVTKIGIRKIY